MTRYKVIKEGLGVPVGIEIPGVLRYVYITEGIVKNYFTAREISLALKLGIIEEVRTYQLEESVSTEHAICTIATSAAFVPNAPKEIEKLKFGEDGLAGGVFAIARKVSEIIETVNHLTRENKK